MNRDELLQELNAVGIQTDALDGLMAVLSLRYKKIELARPLWGLIHQQKPYLDCQAYRIEQAPYYQQNLINLPCSSNLTGEQVLSI